jgi:hypothetical protein
MRPDQSADAPITPRNSRSAGRAVLSFALGSLLCSGAIGCKIFAVRQAAPPTTVSGPKWVTPSLPESVLLNIRVTINARSLTNYSRSLADTFTFVPDPGEEGPVVTYFDGWTREQEIAAMGSILSADTTQRMALTWTAPNGQSYASLLRSVGDNSKYFENLEYELITSSTVSSKKDTTLGRVDLYLKETNDGWYVYKWQDKIQENRYHTWGWVRFNGRVTL